MSEKKEQSAERCVHGVKLINVCTECLQQRLPQLLKPVEQPAASPAQLSAREFKLNGFSLLEILGRHFGQTAMVKYELVPEVAAWAEAFRDASQRQPSEQEWTGGVAVTGRNYIANSEQSPTEVLFQNGRVVRIVDGALEVGLDPNGAARTWPLMRQLSERQPQSVSEEQLQKAAEAIERANELGAMDERAFIARVTDILRSHLAHGRGQQVVASKEQREQIEANVVWQAAEWVMHDRYGDSLSIEGWQQEITRIAVMIQKFRTLGETK